MVDAVEPQNGPPAVDQTGNLTIWVIPGATTGINLDQITKANLDATSANRITYDFIPGGWALTMPQEKTDDPRLTARQRRQSLGIVNPELADLEYVDTEVAKSAAVLLKGGGSFIFVERRKTPNRTLADTGHKVRAIKVSLGVQAPGGLSGSKFTLTQAAVIDYVSEEHALTAS
ncbi:phage tail tube protein [Microbacterium sp. M4A5_1d]